MADLWECANGSGGSQGLGRRQHLACFNAHPAKKYIHLRIGSGRQIASGDACLAATAHHNGMRAGLRALPYVWRRIYTAPDAGHALHRAPGYYRDRDAGDRTGSRIWVHHGRNNLPDQRELLKTCVRAEPWKHQRSWLWIQRKPHNLSTGSHERHWGFEKFLRHKLNHWRGSRHETAPRTAPVAESADDNGRVHD